MILGLLLAAFIAQAAETAPPIDPRAMPPSSVEVLDAELQRHQAHVQALSEAAASEEGSVAPEEVVAATEQRDLMALLLGARRAADADRAALAGEDDAVVLARAEAAIGAYLEVDTAYRALVERLVADRAEVVASDAEHAALEAPRLADFAGGDAHAVLRDAQQRLAHGEAMLKFRERQIELIDAGQEGAARLREDLLEASAAVTLMGSRLVQVLAGLEEVQARIDAGGLAASDLPADPTRDEVWARIAEVGYNEVRRTRVVNELDVRLADAGPREAAMTARDQQMVAVERLRSAVERESQFASIVSMVQASELPDLLGMLRTDGVLQQEIDAARAAVESAQAGVTQALQGVARARTRMDGLDTPFAQREIDAAPERAAAILEELERLRQQASADVALPRDASQDITRRRRTVGEVQREAHVEMTQDDAAPSEAELAALIRDQRASRERHRYLDALAKAVEAYRAGVLEYERSGTALQAVLVRHEQLERQRLAAARELRSRVGRDVPPLRGVLSSIDQHLQSGAFDAAVAARSNAGAMIADAQQSFQRTLERVDAFLAIMNWSSRSREHAERKVDLIGRPVAHVRAARLALADLPDHERQDLEFEASQRAANRSLLQRGLTVLADTTLRSRFEVPLAAINLEIVNLERIRAEYEEARLGFEELIRVTEQSRGPLEGALEKLRSTEQIRLRDYQVARYQAASAAVPEAAIPLATDYRGQFGEELPKRTQPASTDMREVADRLLGAEARLWGDRRWIVQLEHRLSRLGMDTEMNRYRVHVSEIGREIETNEAVLVRLHERADAVQAECGEALEDHGLGVLLRLAVIPALALVLVRMLRATMRTVMRRVEVDDEDPDADTDRQRRLETLTSVAGASVTALIWVIAVIYILSSIGLDVTPIVASASVAGLAVAFGAQALIRDFFAGFFILLENQFTVGDVIDVGAAMGAVEHISLRVTTLRDLEGVVHYVPNGQIQRVSNKTKEWARSILEFQVSYEEDIDRVTACLESVLAELQATAPFDGYLLEPPVVSGVQSMSETAVGLRVMAKTKAGRQWETGREIRKRVRRRFQQEGIEAPYPRRIIRGGEGAGPAAAS